MSSVLSKPVFTFLSNIPSLEINLELRPFYYTPIYRVLVSDKGRYLHVFDYENHIVYDSNTNSINTTYSVDDPFDIRAVNGSNSSGEICISTRRSDRYTPSANIECSINMSSDIKYFNHNERHNSALLTTILNDNSTELILIFPDNFIVYIFEKDWDLYN